MFHVPAHKQTTATLAADAARFTPAAPAFDVVAAQRIQNAHYAAFLRHFRSRWNHCADQHKLRAALQDCNETLALQDEPSAYAGKLLAEMDVLRDRLLDLSQRRRA